MSEQKEYFVAIGALGRAKVHFDVEELVLTDLGLSEVPRQLAACTRLRTLDLSGNRIAVLKHLPPTLEFLRMRFNRLQSLEGLPLCTTVADFTENDIVSLEGCPPLLRELNVCGNRLRELRGLPPLLLKLHACCNPLQRLDPLPRYLTNLMLDGAPDLVRDVNSGKRVWNSLRDDALAAAARPQTPSSNTPPSSDAE